MEIIGAALAIMVKGHPVKVRWSRAQEFYNTYQRQGVIARIKLGVKKDGTITAIEHSLHWDAGGYVEYGANVVNAVGLSATGPYRIPNVKIDSVCVYTNLPPGGPYRGFGYSEFHLRAGIPHDAARQEARDGPGRVPAERTRSARATRWPTARR